MKGNNSRKIHTSEYVRIALAMMLAFLMVITSLSPVGLSFAEDAAGDDGLTKATETADKEELKEEPKPKAPEPEPEPKATEPRESDQKGETSDEAQATPADKEDPEIRETKPTDQTKQDKDKDDASEEMPAQSFSGSAGGVSVKASAEKGVFPKGTKMKVSPVSSAYVIKAANAAMGDRIEVVDAAAVDISFYNNGKEIQPDEGSVSVKLNAGSVDGQEHEAVHITPGGSVQVIGGASARSATFRADHFSIYGIIGEDHDGVETKARYTYIFEAFGGEIDRQTVIDGEKLTEPAAPNVATGEFKGWMIEGENTPLNFPYTVSIPNTETTDKEIVVNAVIAKTFRATFWRDEERSAVLETKTGEAKDVITTGDVTWKFPDGKAITGWTLKGEPVTSFEITEDVDLLPVISEEVFAVSFETGEGSPVPTVFVEKGKTVAKPADPDRNGYEFKGWFTDSACTKAYDFTAPVNADLKLYAKWEGQQTTYKVVYWQENANDDNYTIKEIVPKSAKAGETATYDKKNTEDGREYQGFTLNSVKSDELVLVKGDGTTIKNVYYDRKTYPFSLYKVEISYGLLDIFHLFPIYDSSLIETKEFKYQADTREWYNQIMSQYPGREWFTKEDGTVSFTAPPPMQPPGGGSLSGFQGLKAYGRTMTGTSYIYYLDYADRTTEIIPKHVGGREDWNFTAEDRIIIPGWTFKFQGSTGYESIDGKWVYVGRLYYSRNNYKLTFDPQDSTPAVTVNNVPYEAALAGYVPSSPKVGDKKTFNGIEKTFAGWFDNEAGIGSPIDFSAMKMPALSNNGDTLMFYGKWTSDTHVVSFDLDGGQYDGNDAIDPQEIESGNQATAPDADKMRKTDQAYGEMTFGGWQDNSGKRFSFDTRITRDIELKAIWNTDGTKLLRVEYDANGGQGSFSDGNNYQDGAHAIIGRPPVAPKGKYFVGWQVGKSDVILASGSFQVKLEDADANKVVKLTAQYAVKPSHPVTVVYDANGGKFDDGKDTKTDTNAVVNGNYIVADYAPTRDGHTFKGWALESGATVAVLYSGDKVASGKDSNILYAVYEQNVSPKAVVVKIIGNNGTKTYNGSEQEVTGFTYTVKDNDNNTLDGAVTVTLAQGKTARAAGTDAGEYEMNLTEDHFNITPSAGYTINKVEIVDGKLTIKPKEVIITTGSAEKVYDGTPLTNGQASIEGLVPGETASVEAIGSQTEVGTSSNTYMLTWSPTVNENNYTVVEQLGTLKVTSADPPNPPGPSEITVTITGKTASVPYDGKEHSISGYDVKITGSDVYTKDDFKFTGIARAKGTKAGVYWMGLAEDQFMNQNSAFPNVKFVVEDGYLEITETEILDIEEDGEDIKDSKDNSNGGRKSTESGSSAKTGDDSLMALCIFLIALAMIIVGIAMIREKRQKSE